MKTLIFLSFATTLLAQEAAQTTATPPSPALSPAPNNNTCGLVIDPKARANDYVQAFNLLRKDKPTLKVMLRTPSETLSNITDLSVTQGGTLFIVKLLSPQGTKVQILPVEQLMEIGYSPQ